PPFEHQMPGFLPPPGVEIEGNISALTPYFSNSLTRRFVTVSSVGLGIIFLEYLILTFQIKIYHRTEN
ncbi:MAG: hypothetical protein QXO67_02475, partial [Candidatus Bathyarchaeia archaeon]